MKPQRPEDLAPDELDDPFWAGCRRDQFLVHRCGACQRSYWPASCCIDHGAEAMDWVETEGAGVVHTYTVVHHAYEERWAASIPYTLAVVELACGPFFHTDLVECDPADVHVGMPVEVVYDHVDDGIVIPRFRPRGPS